MDEGKARKELDTANRAQRIFEDDLVQDALDEIRESFYKAFAESRIDEDDKRRHARMGLLILERFESAFKEHMTTGKFAQIELSKLEN